MNEEMKGLQAQIDLMCKVLKDLVSESSRSTKIERRACMEAREMAQHPDQAVAKAAKEWGEKWFPHRPSMDDPWNA